ncbi:hypothetical protein M422DRAFT_268137 [Sphaerobolus stellatus SS14]|uniref:Ubiquitin-like protease family profile domain-containing protein n=1 Tax=Sphaerobolus stellatus (strain SS14) TaxID=990650 RepID=A0A0C9UZ33_SPHS4|nr:hypothetical protein M422DRAFT_268137 [Sphaerobolus stellatus SS14]
MLQVLHNIREILDHFMNDETVMHAVAWVRKEIGMVRTKEAKQYWLILAHVPGHWSLVLIDWQSNTIRFMDSMPRRLGAEEDEARVQQEGWDVLALVREGFSQS